MISRFARSFIAIIVALLFVTTVAFLHPPSRAYLDPWTGEWFGEGGVEADARLPNSLVHTYQEKVMSGKGAKGGVIMSKLGNETAKAELGRATWKLLHTMTLRYPENPTQDERDALEAYIYLTARLYPCGECATEFQALLEKYPPQTVSRLSASLWLCSLHNEVNVRLGKSTFDCSKLDSEYDCGCGDTDTLTPSSTTGAAHPRLTEGSGDAGGEDPMDLERDLGKDDVTGVRMIKGGRR